MLEHHNVSKTKFVSLITLLGEVPDPRRARTREHDLVELLVIALCTLLCRGESFYDMEEFARVRLAWLRTFLSLRGGVPSHDTFNRLFQALDPKARVAIHHSADRLILFRPLFGIDAAQGKSQLSGAVD